MAFQPLPRTIDKLLVPPIKCQGIKTKLVAFIQANIQWDGQGRWVEPFLGSGVVLFNVQPQRAKVSDTNPHIINLYQRIYDGSLTPKMIKDHLVAEGKALEAEGEKQYYRVRDRFNETADPLDFLFLNRSCFNGLIRFNKQGKFNVPFCRKVDRFRPAYITKIVNQAIGIRRVMHGKEWDFQVATWQESLRGVQKHDFVYLDPPYFGRHTDYYNQWSEAEAIQLAETARWLPCGFALSMWKANRYRANDHLADYWSDLVERTNQHFYHLGPTEELRNSIEEALLIKPGHEAPLTHLLNQEPVQIPLF